MKTLLFILPFVLALSCQPNKQKNSSEHAEKAKKLVQQLSLEEKVAQLKLYSYPYIQAFVSKTGEVNADSLKKYFPYGVGGIGIDKSLEPLVYLNVAQSINDYNKTIRVPIPAMYLGEGLHGFMGIGATVFPQAIALGCSWDPALLEKCYSATALEASAHGVKQILSPVLDLSREPRFGRTEEMYSEDAYLVGEYAKAAVWGFQGRNGLPDSNHVASTLKHFAGHGIPEGGRNIAPVNISPYDLLNEHVQPFARGIEAGVLSIMPSYNEINGVPNHASHWLLHDVLEGKLGFSGLITSDQNALDELYRTHGIINNAAEAGKLAIENGIHVDIRYTSGTFDELVNLVHTGKLDEKYIDEALTQWLTLKYQLGMFEAKPLDPDYMLKVTNCDAHKKLALEAAEKSLVLLKNENNLLPLQPEKLKTVAVIGPCAKGVHFGGYTAEPRVGIDVLEGVEQYSQGAFNVVYAEGCKIAKEESSFWVNNVHTPNEPADDQRLIAEAVKTAQKSDVVVLAIGETVSFSREAWGEYHLGDRESLELLGAQNQLVEALLKTGKPVIALMFGGRPLSFNLVAEKVPSIVQVFYPGQEGGTAISNLLFGKINPSGKLAITIPKSVGQLPCYYSRKPSRNRSYIYFEGSEPLFAFGFGLSYTNYTYGEVVIDKNTMTANDTLTVSVPVTNSGSMAGEEIVQLYIHDVVSRGVRPVMELKDFTRVALAPGETKTVTFKIGKDKLAYYNPELIQVIEPGVFEVLVGTSSKNWQKVSFTFNEL